MGNFLDRRKKYKIQLPDECWWIFAWESHKEFGNTIEGWWAFRRRPGGSIWVALGIQAEIEVFQKLTVYSHKLDDDDALDLSLYLYRGGLEFFLDHNRTSSW